MCIRDRNDKYLILYNQKFRKLAFEVKESIVTIKSSYFSKKHEKIKFNWSGEIQQNKTIYIYLKSSKKVLMKSEFQDVSSLKKKIEIEKEYSDKIALFEVMKIDGKKIHIKTQDDLPWELNQELILELCE